MINAIDMKFYTHAGLFHADEVMAFAITHLAGLTSADELVRLTDLDNIPSGGIVADIGREWIPAKRKFDHHQGFFLRDNGYPLASAGMVWEEFGEVVVANLYGEYDTQIAARRVSTTLIQGIDAHDADNSYNLSASCCAGDVRVLSLSNVISMYNGPDVNDHENQRHQFLRAAHLAVTLLLKAVDEAVEFVKTRRNFNAKVLLGGRLLVLEEGCPWKEIVEEDYPSALYVISPSNHPGSPFSMIAVPVKPSSREVKKPIERPDWFKGFIHQGKWIAGGKSVEELTKLAIHSMTRST